MTATKKRTRGVRAPDPFDVAARIGNDDAELEADGIAVGTIDGMPGMALPERVRQNATPEQMHALVAAFVLTRQHMKVLRELSLAVKQLRRLGLSWETIGWVTGLSQAGARKRWGES